MLLGMLSKIFWDVDWNFDLDVDLKMLTKVLFKGEVLKEGWDEVNKATFMVKQEYKVNNEEEKKWSEQREENKDEEQKEVNEEEGQSEQAHLYGRST